MKTCPFEFRRHVRLQADTKLCCAFLQSSVSQNEFKKGLTGFQAGDWNSR